MRPLLPSCPWFRPGLALAVGLLACAVSGGTALAQDDPPAAAQKTAQPPQSSQQGANGQTLSEMAADADAIAVVRVNLTEYQKTRAFPSSGWALLEVLVAYRGVSRGDKLEVREKGLGDQRCYYPELGAFQFEGDRFLVFLKRSEGETWRGQAPACRLPVLVDSKNQFALRYPVKGLVIEDPSVIRAIEFVDPASRVDASDFTQSQIQQLKTFYQAKRVISDDPLAPPDLVFQYSQGLYLSDVRRLINQP